MNQREFSAQFQSTSAFKAPKTSLTKRTTLQSTACQNNHNDTASFPRSSSPHHTQIWYVITEWICVMLFTPCWFPSMSQAGLECYSKSRESLRWNLQLPRTQAKLHSFFIHFISFYFHDLPTYDNRKKVIR